MSQPKIRFEARDINGKRIVGMGLTKELMARLLEGELVTCDFPELQVVLVGGDTEVSITQNLKDKGMITADTNMHLNEQALAAAPKLAI